MKVDGSEKGALGSATVAPRRDISCAEQNLTEIKLLALLLVRDTFDVKAAAV